MWVGWGRGRAMRAGVVRAGPGGGPTRVAGLCANGRHLRSDGERRRSARSPHCRNGLPGGGMRGRPGACRVEGGGGVVGGWEVDPAALLLSVELVADFVEVESQPFVPSCREWSRVCS